MRAFNPAGQELAQAVNALAAGRARVRNAAHHLRNSRLYDLAAATEKAAECAQEICSSLLSAVIPDEREKARR